MYHVLSRGSVRRSLSDERADAERFVELQGRRLLRSRPIEQAVESLAAVLGLTPEQSAEFRQPIRRRRRPLREVLIYLLWKNREYSLPAIGSCFQVEYTTITNARTQGQRHLERDRKLRRRSTDLGATQCTE